MGEFRVPVMAGLSSVVASEMKRYRSSFANIAFRQRGQASHELVNKLGAELVRFSREFGPEVIRRPEIEIKACVQNIAFGLIELSQALPPEEQITIPHILSSAIEQHHPSTAGHQLRVMDISMRTSELVDFNNPLERTTLSLAALLHDIGKIAVPESLLDKNTALTSEENSWIKRGHLLFGYHLLNSISYLQDVARIIGYNHVFDGYMPEGFSKETMPLSAEILSAADFLDALTDNQRNYRKDLSLTPGEAIQEVFKRSYNTKVSSGLLIALINSGKIPAS